MADIEQLPPLEVSTAPVPGPQLARVQSTRDRRGFSWIELEFGSSNIFCRTDHIILIQYILEESTQISHLRIVIKDYVKGEHLISGPDVVIKQLQRDILRVIMG